MSLKDPSYISESAALFARLGRLIITSASVDEVMQEILQEALRACGGIRAFLAIADHDRGELDVRYTAGSGWSEEKRLGRLRVSEETGRGITSHVAATGRPYISSNVLQDPYYIRSFEDVRSEIAVPVVDRSGRTRGVLNVESVQLDAFNQHHQLILTGFAEMAAVAITVFDHRSRETALIQVGRELYGLTQTKAILQRVIDLAASALKFEDCSLFLLDRSGEKLVLQATTDSVLKKKIGRASYAVGEGLTGWVAQQQKSIRVTDPRNDPRWKGRFEELPPEDLGAFMAVPIYGRSGVIGVLRVQRRKSPYKWFPNDFSDDEEEVLSTIAAGLGVALDNARLVDQLVKAERLAAWGEMSARSAHMIGNRVFGIKGDINELEHVLSQQKSPSPEVVDLLGSVRRGIFNLEEILNEFREFVKAGQLDTQIVDINDVLKEAVDEGFPKRSKVELDLRLAESLPPVEADPKKLKRCFTELIENSINFQQDGGRISIETSIGQHSARKWLKPGQDPSHYVQVRFEDTGPGVRREDKAKIFNPFHTSRAKGMGLGLSIVKSIVEAHNGAIFEDGTPGKGARFTILLPSHGTEEEG